MFKDWTLVAIAHNRVYKLFIHPWRGVHSVNFHDCYSWNGTLGFSGNFCGFSMTVSQITFVLSLKSMAFAAGDRPAASSVPLSFKNGYEFQ